MKRYTVIMILSMLALSLSAKDDISIQNVQLGHNEYGVLSVKLNNDSEYTAFQMDITLPDNVSIRNVADEDGNEIPDISLSPSRRKASHTIGTRTLSNGDVRVIAYSTQNDCFSGTEGDLLNVGIHVSGESGSVLFHDVSFVCPDGNSTQFNDASAMVFVVDPIVVHDTVEIVVHDTVEIVVHDTVVVHDTIEVVVHDTVVSYVYIDEVPVPEIIIAGDFVTITCENPSAAILYTTDGSMPTYESNVYIEPFRIDGESEISAMAVMQSDVSQSHTIPSELKMTESDVVSVRYYDTSGKEVTEPSDKISVVITTYSDGGRTVVKKIRN